MYFRNTKVYFQSTKVYSRSTKVYSPSTKVYFQSTSILSNYTSILSKKQTFTLEVQKYIVEKKTKNKVVESAIWFNWFTCTVWGLCWYHFFELMPCALEAQTVIKTFCLWFAIPTCWRIGESKKLRVFKTTPNTQTANNNPTKNKPEQPKKTPTKLRENTTLSESPQAAQYCFAMS